MCRGDAVNVSRSSGLHLDGTYPTALVQHRGVPRLWVRIFSALIFLLSAAEAWSGEGMVHHMVMTFTGQPGHGSPVTHVPKSIESQVQMAANNQAPVAYFLDQLPPTRRHTRKRF